MRLERATSGPTSSNMRRIVASASKSDIRAIATMPVVTQTTSTGDQITRS